MVDPVKEEPVKDDRRTLSTSLSANDALARLVAHGFFAEQVEAYRVGIAVALARGLTPGDVPERKNVTTKYNVGSVDPEGKLRTLVQLLLPDQAERPYAAMEWLAEAGLRFLINQIDAEHRMLSEALTAAGEEATEAASS